MMRRIDRVAPRGRFCVYWEEEFARSNYFLQWFAVKRILKSSDRKCYVTQYATCIHVTDLRHKLVQLDFLTDRPPQPRQR